jgi:hypothetical protein
MSATRSPRIPQEARPTAAVSFSVPVSDYHFAGMRLAGLVGFGGTADGWASRTLSLHRLPKPAKPYSMPAQPTGRLPARVVNVAVPRERLDAIEDRARRARLTVEEWIHAALVRAAGKYRAILDRQPPIRPVGRDQMGICCHPNGWNFTFHLATHQTEEMESRARAAGLGLREWLAAAIHGDPGRIERIALTPDGYGHVLRIDVDKTESNRLQARSKAADMIFTDWILATIWEGTQPQPQPSNVIPFFTGHFRPAFTIGQEGEP